eukprot:7389980-Prymnesium_polylepis.1
MSSYVCTCFRCAAHQLSKPLDRRCQFCDAVRSRLAPGCAAKCLVFSPLPLCLRLELLEV